MTEINNLLKELKAIHESSEPKRYIVNSIGEGDNVDQQEFDDIISAVHAYTQLKDTRHNEIIDTKHGDEIICTNAKEV